MSLGKSFIVVFAVVFAMVVPGAKSSAAQDPVWVPVTDGAEPDDPAFEITAMPIAATQGTQVEIMIHGFWQQEVMGADGLMYQRITVPGLPTLGRPGAPELPRVPYSLLIPTDASEVQLTSVNVADLRVFGGYSVYPQPIMGEDEDFEDTEDPGPGDTEGTDEMFTKDASIYSSTEAWPADWQPPDRIEPDTVGPFSVADFGVAVMKFEPMAGRLQVAAHIVLTYAHAGSAVSAQPITVMKAKLAAKKFVNWNGIKLFYPADEVEYHSRYLIVIHPFWISSIQAFVNHKKQLGFDVTVAPNILSDFTTVRTIIQNWYAAGSPGEDHFVLLVGDTDTIPLGVTSGGTKTDDLYASPVGMNGSKEVYLGRLSVDGPADLEAQAQKIINYERFPYSGTYREVVLVAHKQEPSTKYQNAHESVRLASYSHPPTFFLAYGAQGATDAFVRGIIDADVGLVCYRGHGSTNAWSDWNLSGEDFHKNDVLMLNNQVKPVVWAVTCTNSNLDAGFGTLEDSIGETWLEASGIGAVAHYGATRTTSTIPNHELDRRLFEAVYDLGITMHAQAIELAETAVWLYWPGHKNPWAYLLLGDPSMRIRRDTVPQYHFNFPHMVQSGEGDAGTFIGVQILGETGGPAHGALVSFWKPSAIAGAPDEAVTALWTDESGVVETTLQLSTPGTLYWTVQNDDGVVAQGETEVTMGSAWRDLGEALPGELGDPSLVGIGSLQADTPLTLLLTDALPGGVAHLCFGLSDLNVPFMGGTMVPDIFTPPGSFVTLFTNANGTIQVDATWPSDVPSGLELYLQYWVEDPVGIAGFAASNAIVGMAP